MSDFADMLDRAVAAEAALRTFRAHLLVHAPTILAEIERALAGHPMPEFPPVPEAPAQ